MIWKMYGVDPQVCPKCGGEREIIAMILRDDVIVKILEHVGLPSLLPVFKKARDPPIQASVEQAARIPHPLHFEEGFFADHDYSEFDCVDEPSDIVQCDSNQVERKDSRPPTDLLDLVDYFPGKKLCCTKVPLRGASELLEDEENKTS